MANILNFSQGYFICDTILNVVKTVKQSYKNHLVAFTLGPLLKLIEAFFDLLIPLFMKAIIDLNQYGNPELIQNNFSKRLAEFIRLFGNWIPSNQSLSDAIIGAVIILVMGLVGYVITMVAQYIAARTAMNVGTEIREALFNKILNLSKKDREQFGNGRLQTSLNSDTYQVQQAVLFFVRLIARAPFVILGALVFSFILDWKIGIAFAIIIPLIWVVFFAVLRKSGRQYVSIQSSLDDISTKSTDDIAGARVIRAFNNQENENAAFEETTSIYESKSIRVHKLNSLINPVVFAITAIVTIAIVFLCRGTLLGGSDTEKVVVSSTIIAEMAYLAQIFFAVCQLPPVLLDIVKGGVSRKRIDAILTYQSSVVSGNKTSYDNKVIEFKNVCFTYKNNSKNYALKDISFVLNKGKTLGIIGGTGSGKSTIINLIERFYDSSKGEILYKGVNIKEYNLSELRKEIGLVNQKSSLFKGTIKSNFLMANPQTTDEEITNALKKAEAYEFVSKYEDYLNHEVNEGGSNFSGGQKQRLCIARGLIKNPDVLILDDSTSALDLLTDKKIRNALSESLDMTKIIVSQRVATIADADQIILLDKGQIIGIGNHKELLENNVVYKEIYESQTKKG